MRKVLFAAALVSSSFSFMGGALAEGSSSDDKRFGIGGDLQLAIPVGDFGKATGPLIGPLVRFGYRVIPPLELTGRVGYLFGLSKTPDGEPSGASFSYSDIPVWLGARYFFMDPHSGLYAAAELTLNFFTTHISGSDIAGSSATREGVNVGAGYVISENLPIDFRAQLSLLNLLGKDTGESTFTAIGVSVGYTYSF